MLPESSSRPMPAKAAQSRNLVLTSFKIPVVGSYIRSRSVAGTVGTKSTGGFSVLLCHLAVLLFKYLRRRRRWHHAGGQLPYRHYRWVRRRHGGRLVGRRRRHRRHGKLGLVGLMGRRRRGREGAPWRPWRRREAVRHADHIDDGGVVGRRPHGDNGHDRHRRVTWREENKGLLTN